MGDDLASVFFVENINTRFVYTASCHEHYHEYVGANPTL